MLRFLKNHVCPIGIDVGDDRIKLIQLENNGKVATLLGGASQARPQNTKPGSSQWQKWVIDTVKEQTGNGNFKGKDIVASVPTNDIFIDHLKTPKAPKGKIEKALVSRIKQRLPYEPDQAMLQYISTEDDNTMVMVMEREKVDRHLAVYEQANLNIKSLEVWPLAITKTYTKFFGRRKTDLDAIVFILDIEPENCNVVICRHLMPLFARSIQIGSDSFEDEEAVKRCILELTSCRRHFNSLYKKAEIERMLFLASDSISVTAQNAYATIARQMELPAQMGNCLAAVETSGNGSAIERRGCNFSWATAFGLSLSSDN